MYTLIVGFVLCEYDDYIPISLPMYIKANLLYVKLNPVSPRCRLYYIKSQVAVKVLCLFDVYHFPMLHLNKSP